MSEEGAAYTADAVAVLGYLADRLPSGADGIFERAERGEATLWIPSIVLGEVLFTLLKGKEVFGHRVPPEKFVILLDSLEHSVSSRVHELGIGGWRRARDVKLNELHDRMVVATYHVTGSRAILTDDSEIAGLADVKTIW